MRYILFLFLFISIKSFSQCRAFKIGVKGDTLNCVDIKGIKQGRWVNKLPPLRGEKGYEEQGIDISTDSTIKAKTDTTGKKTVAKPQAVLDYEKKNAGKKKIKVRDGRTGY